MTEPSGLDETPPDVREAHSESERLSISYLSALAIVQARAPQYQAPTGDTEILPLNSLWTEM